MGKNKLKIAFLFLICTQKTICRVWCGECQLQRFYNFTISLNSYLRNKYINNFIKQCLKNKLKGEQTFDGDWGSNFLRYGNGIFYGNCTAHLLKNNVTLHWIPVLLMETREQTEALTHLTYIVENPKACLSRYSNYNSRKCIYGYFNCYTEKTQCMVSLQYNERNLGTETWPVLD